MKILITFLSLAFFCSDYAGDKDCLKDSDNLNSIENHWNEADIFEYLEETKESLKESVEGLSEEQMQFKPDAENWSVAQTVEHIITVEGALKSMLQAKFDAGEDLDQKTEIVMTDDDVVALITNRTEKIKTQDQFQPTGKLSSADEALEAFEDQREDIVDWLKDSDVDMRNYVNEFPFGKIDAYQTVLFMAGHTARHTAQIEEVKSNPDFPDS